MIQLTDVLQTQILAFLRAGGSPEVAAQAAGVSAERFAQWMRWGRSRNGSARYRQFAEAIDQALAQARLGAEVAIRGEKPLEWLRHGSHESGRARSRADGLGRGKASEAVSPLATPEFRDLLSELLVALEPYPEARQAAATALIHDEEESEEESEKRSGERA
jgi:hypothetical protein